MLKMDPSIFGQIDIPLPGTLLSTAKLYAVGGAVRDAILGLTPQDIDYVIVGSDEKSLLNAGLKSVGASFPVFLTPSGIEIAMSRKERKVSEGHGGFEFEFDKSVTLEDDLKRRDITINSLAVDLTTGEVIDPLNGFDDLNFRIIRANTGAFAEDPLRALRVARLSARFGFSIEPVTVEAIKSIPSTEFKALSSERVVLEFEKAYHQVPRFSDFLNSLQITGVLKHIFPELEAMVDTPEPLNHHPEGTTFIHTGMVVDQLQRLNGTIEQFWAALLHDIAKPVITQHNIDKITGDIKVQHIGHDKEGVPMVKGVVRRFNLSNDILDMAVFVTRYHMALHEKNHRAITKARMLNRAKVAHDSKFFFDALLVTVADGFGRKQFYDASLTTMSENVSELFAKWKSVVEAYNLVDVEGMIQRAKIKAKEKGKPFPIGDALGDQITAWRAEAIRTISKGRN